MTDDSRKIAAVAAEAALAKKAADICIMDMNKVSGFAEFFVVCHADSDVQVKAVSSEIIDRLHEKGVKVWHKEGMQNLHWVLLDYVNVVVHVFRKEYREFYDLERLWGDAEIEIIGDEDK